MQLKYLIIMYLFQQFDYKYMENSEFLEFPINFIKEFYIDANNDFKL